MDGCEDKVGEGARKAENGSLPPIPTPDELHNGGGGGGGFGGGV